MDNTFNARAAAEAESSLGTIAHYNGFIFENMTATQADCEGALAVGGDARFGSTYHGYDIGGAGLPNTESVMIGKYENPNDYPSFLLGGSMSMESTTSNVHTGAVVLRSSNQQEYESGSFQFSADSLRYEADEVIASFFQDAKTQILHTSEVLLNGSEKRITQSELRLINTLDHTAYRGDFKTDKHVQVYTLDCGEDESITIGEIDFGSFVNDYDMIVINLPARSVTFTGGAILYEGQIVDTSKPRIYEENKTVALLAGKVVFNFPNAEEIYLNYYGITGTILAPNAYLSGNGGSINGMLVANSLLQDGGMELHAFTVALSDLLWTLEVDGVYGHIALKKTDGDGQPLGDAQFSLYDYDPETDASVWITDGTTDPDGTLVFYDLEPGWYKLVEAKSPPGYVLPDIKEWIFELVLNDEGDVTQLEIIYIKNELAKGVAEFLKVDYDDNSILLADAVFALYMLNEESGEYKLIQEGLSTNNSGMLVLSDLAVGSYRLVETQAPIGYHLRDGQNIDFAITLDDNGNIQKPDMVTILNQQLATVQLIKQDADDAELLLSGAVFDLLYYNEETAQYETIASGLTTDANGQITVDNLEPGSYKFVETAAPDGYYLTEGTEVEFVVELDADGWIIELSPIVLTNKELGKVEIIKVDQDDESICLEGAVFSLYKQNETTSEYDLIRSDLITESDGHLLIENLEPGSYKLVETQSPRGYVMQLIPEVTFDISL